MARDRQRAKRRRKAQSTPAPNPLKHSSAEIDEALMAEKGVPVPPPQDDPAFEGNFEGKAFEAEPDQIEGDLVPSSYDRADIQHELESVEDRSAPWYRRTITFLGHVVDELRRVQWPTRRQTIQGTAVTLGFVIVAGAYLGLLDALWKPLVDQII